MTTPPPRPSSRSWGKDGAEPPFSTRSSAACPGSSPSVRSVWRWESFERFDEHRCGCGALIDGCLVWGPVLERIVDEHPCGSDMWRESLRWERSVASWKQVPRLLATRTVDDRAWPELRELVRYASPLYRSVADRTGDRPRTPRPGTVSTRTGRSGRRGSPRGRRGPTTRVPHVQEEPPRPRTRVPRCHGRSIG